VIKKFRDDCPQARFLSVEAASEALFDYLISLEVTRAHEIDHAAAVLYSEFSIVMDDFNQKFLRAPRGPKRTYARSVANAAK
jgi:hypothetical protein